MKHTLIVFFLLTFANSICSQDLIVTNEGDSINCRITNIRDNNVYFTFGSGNVKRNTMLHLSKVEDFRYNFYQISDIYEDNVVKYNKYQHFRFALSGGYSYMTAKVAEGVPADFKNYIKGLKSGYHFGGDMTYYFTESLGVGGKCFIFKSSNNIDDIYVEKPNGTREYGKMSDDLTISFIGPIFSTRFLNPNKRSAFLMNVSIGYLGYLDNKILVNKYQIKGSTVGVGFDIGYDIGLSENFSLGFQLSFLTGSLSKYKLNDGMYIETVILEEKDYENLTRIDLSIGLRFNK